MIDHIRNNLIEARDALGRLINNDVQLGNIQPGAGLLIDAVRSGRRVISCGNGGSMCEAMHLAEELSGRFREDRPAIAAVAISDPNYISCVANDYGYDHIFERQVMALGQPGDILVAISTSGNSPNVLRSIEAAHDREMTVIALSGKGGGTFNDVLADTDIHLCVPHDRTMRIQEVHIVLLHALCDGIDALLLGDSL